MFSVIRKDTKPTTVHVFESPFPGDWRYALVGEDEKGDIRVHGIGTEIFLDLEGASKYGKEQLSHKLANINIFADVADIERRLNDPV